MLVRAILRSWLALAAVVMVLLCPMVHAVSGPEKTALLTVVSDLYGRYAWVAVFSTKPPPDAVPLAQASRNELGSIFVPELAQAIWDDAQCAQRRHEICTVDFDLLFDSQDPSASDLTVQADERGTTVLACFKDGVGVRRCLTFVGAGVGGSTKVADIVYPDQRSLRALLRVAKKAPPRQGNATTHR